MTLGRKKHVADRLDYYYKVINTTILSKQDAGSGLIPASVAITVSVSRPNGQSCNEHDAHSCFIRLYNLFSLT